MNPIFAVLPPILALAIGIFSRRILLALFIGVFAAAFISKDFELIPASIYTFQCLLKNSDILNLFNPTAILASDSLCICLFLIILGILITCIQKVGGALAVARFIRTRLHDRRQIEGSSILLSVFFFIDDYFSCLTVGSVMLSITDRYKIARAKLAFLVDSLAAPMAILCPFSGWVAAFMGFIMDSGINLASPGQNPLILGSPFAVYLETMPYLFYSFIALIACIVISGFGISYGPMRIEEEKAARASTFNGEEEASIVPAGHLIDFILPISIMIIATFAVMLQSGGYWLLGGKSDFLDALHHARGALGLLVGGSIALAFSVVFFLIRSKMKVREVFPAFRDGALLMFSSVAVLILSWSLGDLMARDLHSGQVIAGFFVGSVPAFSVPAMFFISSLCIAFAIGSSWGTMAIMFPITVNFLVSMSEQAPPFDMHALPYLFPTLGAVLSGCIAGDHLSPIANTSILASTSCRISPALHFETQIGYGVPMILSAFIGFLVLGIGIDQAFSWTLLPAFSAAVLTLLIALVIPNSRKTVATCSSVYSPTP